MVVVRMVIHTRGSRRRCASSPCCSGVIEMVVLLVVKWQYLPVGLETHMCLEPPILCRSVGVWWWSCISVFLVVGGRLVVIK